MMLMGFKSWDHGGQVQVRQHVSNHMRYLPDSINISLMKYKRGRSKSRSVARCWSNHNLSSVTHDGLHFANAGNRNVINSRKCRR